VTIAMNAECRQVDHLRVAAGFLELFEKCIAARERLPQFAGPRPWVSVR